jgi:uncharacterized protein
MRRLLLILLLAIALAPSFSAPTMAQDDGRVHVAQRRTLMDLLFGDREQERRQQQEQLQRQQEQQQRRQRQQQQQQPQQQTTRRQQQPPAQLPEPEPTVAKAENATRLAVFGDSLAVDLAKALERFYAEDPNLVVINQGVGSSGFVRDDFFDWNNAVREQIAANSFDLAVVIIGINDRQALSGPNGSYDPLTDGWSQIYSQRLNDFLGALREANKPVIWVGLPPMQADSYSRAMTQISSLQRQATFSSGAEFLDIFERFLDESGAYSSYGPNLNGEQVRMRKDDGIHFSNAGADKVAFFLSQSIKLFYSGGGGVTVEVADPLLGTDAGSMLRPPYQGLGQTRMLEVAGAVIALNTTPERATDLLTTEILPSVSQDFELSALMEAPMGRVDSFGLGTAPPTGMAQYAWGQ